MVQTHRLPLLAGGFFVGFIPEFKMGALPLIVNRWKMQVS